MANKKILKSQFSGKKWNDYRVVSLPIKDLWASVPKAETHKGKPFYSRLAEDIAQNGLHYPLLVVHPTRRELIERMKMCEDTFCELPFDQSKGNLNVRLYVIWGGSNRVRVAEELGFTHVDCVIVESFNRAVELQRTHRKPYVEKYYIPPRPASFQVSPSELTLENSPVSVSRDALWKNSLPKLLEALNQPDASATDWINVGICKEALGDHLQAARAFIKAHELDPDKFCTFGYILRNLYLAREFNLLVDYLTYCKHFSPKFTAAFSKEPFFTELFAHEPFKTLADPKEPLPPAETDDPVNEPAAEVKEGISGVMDEAALGALEEAVKQNPENEQVLFSYGLGLKAMDRYAEAAETFLKVQGINPQNEAVYSMIFLCLFRSENRDMLLNFANYCVGLSPELIINFSEDPIYSELFEQPEFKELFEVCKQYQQAELGQQKIASDEVSALEKGSQDLMQQYESLLKDESMLPILKDAVEKNPVDEVAWFNYGSSLKALERYEEAADAFLKVQAIKPENENIYPIIFHCLDRAGKDDVLFQFATYCSLLSPDILPLIRKDESLAVLFEREEFQQLLSSSPVNSEANTQIAANTDPQISALEKEIRANPGSESAWFDYGVRLEGLKRYDEAAEAFMKVQEINPQNKSVYPAIAHCLNSSGKHEMLQQFISYCYELNPDIAKSLSNEKSSLTRTAFNAELVKQGGNPSAKLPTKDDRPKDMNKTFITGVDGNQEWMLKWWYRNITQHNPDIHITICNFGGMSEDVRKWAQAHANHFIEYPKHKKCAWFHKTKALVDSPYEYSCWVDVDCEVLRPIDDIFSYAQDGKIGVTVDPGHARQDPNEHWWATGVCLIKGKPNLLLDWHSISSKATARGDQEALHQLLSQKPKRNAQITEIPIEYQWLRVLLANKRDTPNKKLIHWTGQKGKKIIKEKLIQESDSDFFIPEKIEINSIPNESTIPRGYVVTLFDMPESVASAERCVMSGIKYGIQVKMCPAVDKSNAREEAAKEGLAIAKDQARFSHEDAVIGNFVSQYRIWKEIICLGEPGIVLEHDAVFTASVPDLTGQGEIINLGYPSWGKFRTKDRPGVYPLFSKSEGYMPGAHGYYVTVEGAKELVAAAKKNGAGPVDVFLGIQNFPGIKEIYPWMIKADDTFTTIQMKQGCACKHGFNETYKILT